MIVPPAYKDKGMEKPKLSDAMLCPTAPSMGYIVGQVGTN